MASQRQRRGLKVRLWLVLLVFCAAVAVIPVQSGTLRKLLVGGIFFAWASGLFLFWRSMLARVLFLVPLVAAMGLALIPYRASDGARMQVAYTRALRSYEGVRYVWGGESRLGMDCSGLIRCAMIDASLTEGWSRQDLGLLRTAAALWWYDASAKEIGEGYNGRTHVFQEATTLNTVDYVTLNPGDLAVTDNGMHILAYLGDQTWINADPKGKFAVVTEKAPSKDSWFSTPVKLVRWYRLQ